MTDHQRAQVTMGAQGEITGTLGNWPGLLQTLLDLGVDGVSSDLPVPVVQEICRQLLMNEER